MPTRAIPAAGTWSSRSRTSPTTCAPGDALDLEARRRGNSVLFPGPGAADAAGGAVQRPVLAAAGRGPRLPRGAPVVRPRGRKLRHRFVRALMRSRARLTYEQVQAAADGAADDATAPLLRSVIRPLYGAYAVLAKARRRRGTLDLDLPEAEVRLGPDGRPEAIVTRAAPGCPPADRGIHDRRQRRRGGDPGPGGHALHVPHPRSPRIRSSSRRSPSCSRAWAWAAARGTLARPADLSRLLEQLKEHELSPVVSQLVLRAQSQAAYARATSATSASISAATRISPRRSGATPTWSCIGL